MVPDDARRCRRRRDGHSDGRSRSAAARREAPDGLIEVRLTAIRYAARDTNLFEFSRWTGKPLPAYEPGAHIDLHLPNGLVRQYSLIEAEPDPARYMIGVKRDPASRGGSRHVHDELRVGRTLTISAPRNNFPLVEDAAHVVLFAGGIGITPIWCMVQRLERLGRSWQLYYACRSRADMAFLQPLETMAPAQFHFDEESAGRFLDVAAIVSQRAEGRASLLLRPDPDAQGVRGGDGELAARAGPHRIFHAQAGAPTKTGGFVVELARSAQEFVIPAGKSILQVLLDAGVDVDYSCELGICGACEQRVISGIPEHRDAILTEEEQASNTKVMICCAGCKSERLVLDLVRTDERSDCIDGHEMPVPYRPSSMSSVVRLLIQQRDGLVVRRLRDRLQIGVDVGQILVREHRLAVGRHGAIGGAHEGRERLDRHRVGRELRAGDPALPHGAVAAPAAELHVGGLAFLGGRGDRRAVPEGELADEETGGERRQLPTFTRMPLMVSVLTAAASRRRPARAGRTSPPRPHA